MLHDMSCRTVGENESNHEKDSSRYYATGAPALCKIWADDEQHLLVKPLHELAGIINLMAGW
jgi:hypothetical protein